MKDGKSSFNILASVEKHIEALKPLLPKQAVICAGEYPIKLLLRGPTISKGGPLPILVEKDGDEIYRMIPRGFYVHHILGFEDQKVETHFYYNIQPALISDETILESLKKRSIEKLHGAVVFASVWDGIGSAALPTNIKKLKTLNQDSLGIAVLPSRVQPADAQFNTYAALQACQTIEGATVLLMDRDLLESYQGVDRQGKPIKGSTVANYLVNMCISKDTLVDEVSELSKNFGNQLFTPILITGASLKIYGNIENMLNTAMLKPFTGFDLSTATVLYGLIRLPFTLKDKLPVGKIELTIADWFKDKAKLKSIYITEPIYTQDLTDRIDIALFIGGFDTSPLFSELEKKSAALKTQAVEKGWITEDWQVIQITEPAPSTETPKEQPVEMPAPSLPEEPQISEEPSVETPPVEAQVAAPESLEAETVQEKPKPSRQRKKAETQPAQEKAKTKKATAKPKRTRRTRKTAAK
jgi:hypothetical protein